MRDKLRELLGLRPEVFGVSARQTWKAKAAGYLPDPARNGFGALEAYLLADARRRRPPARQAREPAGRRRARDRGRGERREDRGWRRSPRTRRRSRRSRARSCSTCRRRRAIYACGCPRPRSRCSSWRRAGTRSSTATLRPASRALAARPRADRRALPAGRDGRTAGRDREAGRRAGGRRRGRGRPPLARGGRARQQAGRRRTPARGGGPPTRCPRRTRPGCGRLSRATRRARSRASRRARSRRASRARRSARRPRRCSCSCSPVGAGVGLLRAETAATAVTAGVVGAVVALAAPLPLPIQRAREKARLGEAVGARGSGSRQRCAPAASASSSSGKEAGAGGDPAVRTLRARRRRAAARAVAGARRAQARPRHAAHAHRGTALAWPRSRRPPPRPRPATLFARFVELIARLRAPGGCPWDREQTHESVKPMTIEEAYEVAHAIDEQDDAELAGELGDLLLQVVFHANIAEERGAFRLRAGDRARVGEDGAAPPARLRRRRGLDLRRGAAQLGGDQGRGAGAEGQGRRVDARQRPQGLPAVMEAFQLTTKVSRVGFDWPGAAAALAEAGRGGGRAARGRAREGRRAPRRGGGRRPAVRGGQRRAADRRRSGERAQGRQPQVPAPLPASSRSACAARAGSPPTRRSRRWTGSGTRRRAGNADDAHRRISPVRRFLRAAWNRRDPYA